MFYVAESTPGLSDEQVLEAANERNALLLTADKDFGELVFRLQKVHRGVVLLRLAGLAPDVKAKIVAGVFQIHHTQLAEAFCVVSSRAVRIRPKA